jgi:hypothetical protein
VRRTGRIVFAALEGVGHEDLTADLGHVERCVASRWRGSLNIPAEDTSENLAGYREDAVRVALKWLRLVAAKFDQTSVIFERYNVVDPDGPTPGRYPPQRGFGWTNGVFAALLARIVLGIRPTHPHATAPPPADWVNSEIAVHLPRYPWPIGTKRPAAANPPDK